LISSTIAANVVVLPDPVAPPMMTRPRDMRDNIAVGAGRLSEASAGIFVGSRRMFAAGRPRSRCRFTRKRPTPGTLSAASAIP
jgi:hypothetical protein